MGTRRSGSNDGRVLVETPACARRAAGEERRAADAAR
jgi:hypothetical protein